MLTAAHDDQLRSTGVTRLAGVVDPNTAAVMADAVWDAFGHRGIDRHDPGTWPAGLLSGNQALRRAGRFDAFHNDRTAAVADEVLGAGAWSTTGRWGPALITFPQPGPWTIPHRVWHFDLPGTGDPDQLRVLRLFGYATDVGPHGGGTLVVEGSHELVRRMVATAPGQDAGGSAHLRRRLAACHPWFRALLREGGDRVRQFMSDGDEVDGVAVRVTELTGDAGDVAVMMPWTLHNFSMNCAATPRFMVTHSIYRRDHPWAAAIEQ